MSVLTLSLTLVFAFYFLRPAHSSESEVTSLLEFRKGFKSDPLNKLFSSWVTPTPSDISKCPDSFHGVVCDPGTSSVVAIALDRMGLVGDLKFTTLTNLKYLKNLTLAGNSLTGRLVPSIGSMTSLETLDLSGNQFYGPIPQRLNELWALSYVNLSNNNFSGWFPSGIRNLQQLRILDLSRNKLEGDVGDLVGELRNVEHLDLSENMFSGSISLSSDKVSSLANTVQYVNLSRNDLGGEFWGREVMALFRNLRVLDLSGNGIDGELPDLDGLPNLQVLKLGGNRISGNVPPGLLLQGSMQLMELDLSRNGFSGPIPNINSLTLSVLNLSSNMISGSLPPSVGSCEFVDLSSNRISEDLSSLTNWNENLQVLDLSYNSLTGMVPDLTRFQKLTVLSLRNNSLEGTLPSKLASFAKMNTIDMSSNRFDGEIPSSFFESASLINLNLSGNLLTGKIPLESSRTGELLVLPSNPPMESLDLSNNALIGGLSSDIGSFGRLNVLNLSRNNLSGPIPVELSKLTVLEYLDLSRNDFNGQIPGDLSSNLKFVDVSYNNLSGEIPRNLNRFPTSSFFPGNDELQGHRSRRAGNQISDNIRNHRSSKSNIRIAIIVACVVAVAIIAFVLFAYHQARLRDFHLSGGLRGQATAGGDIKAARFRGPSLFGSREPTHQASLSFSNDHLLTSNSKSLSGPIDSGCEILEQGSAPTSVVAMNPENQDNQATTSGRKSSSGSPRFIDTIEQPVTLDVYSPDRFSGELFFLDDSLTFTAEELSRAPAEVLGRSSHGTLYKATLYNGHMLNVKWLRIGLVRNKKEFAKEVKKIGSIRHSFIVPIRAYYWGPREQERLLLVDYVPGDSLAQHLYETTPRRYTPLSFNQRLKLATDIARGLSFLHERGLPHGNLKPTNIILAGSERSVRLTDYGLHRLMTPSGVSEQILNLGALGYRAPELATSAKPAPSLKADVYAFGVILMELLTRRSAGDIISGQSGAVDLTDWVRLCDREGRGRDCIDRDIAGGEEHTKAMDDALTVSLRCILPVNERPNIRQVIDDLSSISA